MTSHLKKFIGEVQSNTNIPKYDEASIKQAIILPILDSLNWNPFNLNEIHPEYSIGNQRVDYALKSGDFVKVFIEVKKGSEDLENHQEQLLNYSFKRGVNLAILTNGISWWFYLPLREGGWEQRKFFSINLYEQDVGEISERFSDFLLKENCISGKNIQNAEQLYQSKQKQRMIEKTLPVAWEKIIQEQDEKLFELIAEKTEKLCGYKPDYEAIENFISSFLISGLSKNHFVSTRKRTKIESESKQIPTSSNETYAYATINGFTFLGKNYKVKNWTDFLIQICELMLNLHPSRFHEIFTLAGRKRPYFTRKPVELRRAIKIPGSDIYVETNLSATFKMKLVSDVLQVFGYTQHDLEVNIAE